ncbi:MAG: hypothetical protein U1F34_05970 [Gammaproteobacteria bacterium]
MEADAKAAVYNPKTGERVTLVDVGLEPEGVAVSPDGSKVIVTSESTNMLYYGFQSPIIRSWPIFWSDRGRVRRHLAPMASGRMHRRKLAARSSALI